MAESTRSSDSDLSSTSVPEIDLVHAGSAEEVRRQIRERTRRIIHMFSGAP